MKTAEKNRLEHVQGQVRTRILAHVAWLESEIDRTRKDLDEGKRRSPLYLKEHERLTSVPGVGKRTAFSLILSLPELGTLNRKQIAALAGVAPFNRDSGRRRGKKSVWGGRAYVRAVLHMAAVLASRHSRIIQACYERLGAAGKPKKLALTDCMRKLLTILNPMTRNQSPWTPSLAMAH